MIPIAPLSHGQHLRGLRTGAFRLLETHHRQGLAIARHHHEHACLNFVLQGCYREDLGARRGAFEPLTTLYKPAGEPHANRFSDAPARCLLIELADERLVPERLQLAQVAWTRDPSATRSALAVWHELADPDACSALVIDQLALELYEQVLGGLAPRNAPAPRVRAASDALHDAPRAPWTLTSLARHVGLHPSHLARAFRAAHGCTVGEHLRRLRVSELARALALGDRPLSALAQEHGFADQSHATRAFRRWLGTTPAAWRRAFRAR